MDNNGNKYKEVLFLENTGSQYINTGYYPDENTNAKYKVSVITYKKYGPHLLSSENYYFPFMCEKNSDVIASRGNSVFALED